MRYLHIAQLDPHPYAFAGRSAMNIQKMTMQITVIRIMLP
jgi:hypothetical protein